MGNGYEVRIQPDFGNAWIHYEEPHGTLSLFTEGRTREITIFIAEENYLAPDYKTPISEERLAEIQERISEALTQLKIPHNFLRSGWTSIEPKQSSDS